MSRLGVIAVGLLLCVACNNEEKPLVITSDTPVLDTSKFNLKTASYKVYADRKEGHSASNKDAIFLAIEGVENQILIDEGSYKSMGQEFDRAYYKVPENAVFALRLQQEAATSIYYGISLDNKLVIYKATSTKITANKPNTVTDLAYKLHSIYYLKGRRFISTK